jgi:PEP-CTERM motif
MATSFVFRRAAFAGAIVMLSAVAFQTAPARANVVFDFSGTCTEGCSGTSTGVLTLADSYVFGSDITAADFVEFQYVSSDENLVIASTDAPAIVGGLNADGSLNSAGQFSLTVTPDVPVFGPFFEANTQQYTAETFEEAQLDFGNPYAFTLVNGAVPEPATWAMMLAGFAGLGWAGYRRARKARAA